jgi:sensor histidine kinase YesM
VENSIVHAVNLDRPIEVSLYITREQYEGVDSIYICVSDTGDGFSKEVLEAIENDTPIYYNGRKHVGLQNICRRLKLMYGERASVSFSNMAENYGAVVEVRVPAMKEN